MCCVTLRVIRDLQHDKGILEVKLVSVPLDTALGGLKGSDSFFEIYTESMVIDLLLYKELEDLQLLPEAFWRYIETSDKG
jgi:hypothetical protein